MYKRFGKSISNNEIQRQLTEAKNEKVRALLLCENVRH
jgi:hypothetical protein